MKGNMMLPAAMMANGNNMGAMMAYGMASRNFSLNLA